MNNCRMAFKKSTQEQMTVSMQMAKTLKVANIRFVPIPVYDDEDYKLFRSLLKLKLFEMEAKIK